MYHKMNITSDYQAVHRSPHNHSITKMLYSFPKANRFIQTKQGYCLQTSYDLPSVRTSRSTSMGYGQKTTPLIKSVAPSPDKYTIKGSFEITHKSGKSFGIGRDKLYKGSRDVREFPGPGQYPVPSSLSKVSFSLRPKLSVVVKSDIPGPGQYETISTVQIKHPLSTYRNALITTMKGSARSKTNNNEAPGPGTYENQTTRTNGSRFFPRDKRDLFGQTKDRITPGVGSYDMPTEFGHNYRGQRVNTIQ